MEQNDIGAEIVRTQRLARFADTSTEEWGERLVRLISAQPDVVGPVEVSQVRQVGTAAGGSNGTLLFDAIYRTASGQQSRKLVLRFLPAQGLFHRYDVAAQFNLQRQLAGRGLPLAPQCWLDEHGETLGRPGYVMEQVVGSSPPMAWKSTGLIAEASVAERRTISQAYVGALARLHSIDWKDAGLQWLTSRANGIRPIEREANWYWDALLWSGDTERVASLGKVRDWLVANEPELERVVVCHGDANYGNYLFEGTRLTAVVDWEMSFLGSPECDLTFLKMGDQILQADVPWPEGVLDYDEMAEEYERITGYRLRNLPYFELFTAYRLSIINVLARRHLPEAAKAMLGPILERGINLVVAPARALGIEGV